MNDVKSAGAGKVAAELRPTRYMHTMLRVRDLEKSVDFYTRLLGMREIRRKDFENGRFTLLFLGYADEDDATVLELTHNWDQQDPYDLGTAYGHIALAAPKIYDTCAMLEQAGVKIPRPPGPMKFGGRTIAFIEDPDGYKIELIQST